MADDTGALCNNSTKNHLQLALEQPSKYADDIEAGGTFPDTDEENFDENEEKGDEEAAVVVGETQQEKDSKVPAIYQVEPGCTPLSCYSAIVTFIIMTIGIFWLLLISPPKNSVPVPAPVSLTDSNTRVFDIDDAYDDEVLPSSESPSEKMSFKNTTILGAILRTSTASSILRTSAAGSSVEPPMEQALDDIVRIVKDSGT